MKKMGFGMMRLPLTDENDLKSINQGNIPNNNNNIEIRWQISLWKTVSTTLTLHICTMMV